MPEIDFRHNCQNSVFFLNSLETDNLIELVWLQSRIVLLKYPFPPWENISPLSVQSRKFSVSNASPNLFFEEKWFQSISFLLTCFSTHLFLNTIEIEEARIYAGVRVGGATPSVFVCRPWTNFQYCTWWCKPVLIILCTNLYLNNSNNNEKKLSYPVFS